MIFYEQFSQFANATKDKSFAVSAMFALNQNFRSHQGIISLASFIMTLLYLGFPQHIDQMAEERANNGPIPTLFGMEFDDAFLVDFFTNSPCASSLRKLGNILTSGSCSVDGTKSRILCSELKHLYVAITRARNHLWIFETCPEAVDPIVRLWVDNSNGDGSLVDVMTRSHPNRT
ncbi:hypothetical protein BDD12DRAFT_286629 [Trichophaea hybrida]|nr:hypothetical protein BDD12DRAFT_286629 [Trichophaea hybrida]